MLSCIRSLLSAAYQLWLSPELADYPAQYSHGITWATPELAAAYHERRADATTPAFGPLDTTLVRGVQLYR